MERRGESAPDTPGWHTCLLPPQTFLAPDSVGRWIEGGLVGRRRTLQKPALPTQHGAEVGDGVGPVNQVKSRNKEEVG